MIAKIQAAVQEVVRFLMKLGFSWKKALLVAAIVMSAIITAATTVTYFVTRLIAGAFIRLYAVSSDQVVNYGLAHLIAVIMAMAIFFLLTVGIVLMIDELRNWVIKIFVMAGIVVTAGWLIKLFRPITDGHPRASVLLTVTILIFAFGAIAQVLGQGDALKNFSWLGKMAAVIFFCWLALMGACGGCNTKDSSGGTEKVVDPFPCTFHANGKDYSARVLGPGRFEVMSPQKRASATFTLSTSDGGSWSQTYPKDSGAFKLEGPPDYSTNTLKGVSWTASNPGQQDPMSLTCQSLTTLVPNS